MYILRDYQDNLPPVLNNGFQDIGPQFGYNYIIGSGQDPHWNIYPMDKYLTFEGSAPLNYVFTNYIYDPYHYLYYTADYNSPTHEYAKLLKERLGKVSRGQYIEKTPDDAYKSRLRNINEDKKKLIQQANKSKIKEINTQIKKEEDELEKIKAELKTAKGSRDRAIRKMVNDKIRDNQDELEKILVSVNKKDKKMVRDQITNLLNVEAARTHDSTNAMYSNILTRVQTIEKNIELHENELKKYTD